MTVRFYANGDTGLGYRGRVRYLTATERNHTATRYTHCGGSVETFGGVITMMNMVAKDSEPKLYDCIWLIKPPNSYMHLKSHLLLRINTFEKMGIVIYYYYYQLLCIQHTQNHSTYVFFFLFCRFNF